MGERGGCGEMGDRHSTEASSVSYRRNFLVTACKVACWGMGRRIFES